MKDRFAEMDKVAEKAARFAAVPAAALLSSNVASKLLLEGIEKVQRNEAGGALLIATSGLYTLIAGFSVSYSVQGDRFLKDFFTLIQAPLRLRSD